MAEFPALPLWTDAYFGDAWHLNFEQHGAYLILLMTMWRAPQRKLPNDNGWLASHLNCSISKIETLVRPIIAEFCQTDGNWIWQKRLLHEHTFVTKAHEKRRAAAKARWDKQKASCNAYPPTPTPTPTPTQERKEERLVGASRPQKGTRLAEDWKPNEEGLLFATQQLGSDASIEFDKFRDYWLALPGAKGSKLDWNRTWRNWVRNAHPKRAGNGKVTKPASQRMLELADQLERGEYSGGGKILSFADLQVPKRGTD